MSSLDPVVFAQVLAVAAGPTAALAGQHLLRRGEIRASKRGADVQPLRGS